MTCSDCKFVYSQSEAAKERARLAGRERERIIELCPRHASVGSLIEALKSTVEIVRLNARELDDAAWKVFAANSPTLRQADEALRLAESNAGKGE